MKKLLSLLLISILAFSFAGCGGSENKKEDKSKTETNQEMKNEKSKEEKKEDKKTKLDGLKEAYKKAGTVGENEELAFQILGANNGYKFKFDGELIEIYEYDMSNLSEEGKKIVDQAKKGSVDMSGINIPVKYKDGLMLVRHNDHSKRDKVIEIFNNYK